MTASCQRPLPRAQCASSIQAVHAQAILKVHSLRGSAMKALNRFLLTSLLVLATSAGFAQGTAAVKAPAMNLTIYHIEGRRSERIVWLCEELGLPYKLEYKRGDVAASMNTIRGISPLMPVAPTVRIYDQVMVESGAIIELILAREGKGRLMPAVNSPD